jgi:hypothetical protein
MAPGLRGYEEDDQVNAAVAAYFGAPLHQLPAFCTGGNIMSDGLGTAFSTRQMLAENAPYWNEQQFRQLAETYLGITDYHFVENPEVHGIQHIDCYAKLLDEEAILVKEVEPSHAEYLCVENLVTELEQLTSCYGRPYVIHRVFCGPYNASHDPAAYTNSLILNDKVYVPLFNISSDEPALETYRAAMPGYEVIGFPYGGWYYYDALHCRTMGLFDRHMLRVLHRRLDAEMPYAEEFPLAVMIDDRSEAGLVAEQCVVRWRMAGASVWNDVQLVATAAPDSFTAVIPGQPVGTTIEYYVLATDQSGRQETLPRPAPAGWYEFEITGSTAVIPGGSEAEQTARAGTLRLVVARPNPFRSETRIHYQTMQGGPLLLEIFDAAGRNVRTLIDERTGAGIRQVRWDGLSDTGDRVPAGVYFVRLGAGDESVARKLIVVR